MVASVPKLIDPWALADKNAKLEGRLVLNDCDRMSDLLFDDKGQVDFLLHFYKEDGLVKITGHLSGEARLKCQRCLESLSMLVDVDVNLGVIKSFNLINRLPKGFEPLLIHDDEKIVLKDIIEDELLLLIPNVPKHQNNCLAVKPPVDHLNDRSRSIKNPFSVLADLKKLEKNNGSTKK